MDYSLYTILFFMQPLAVHMLCVPRNMLRHDTYSTKTYAPVLG
jgi:hypothetical protein